MRRKIAFSVFAALVLFLMASAASQASRVYITGAFLPVLSSPLSPAERYVQVYADFSTDSKGKPMGTTSIAGVDAHIWGAATVVDLSKYDFKAGTGTIKIVSKVTYNALPATSTIRFKRAHKNDKWQIAFSVIGDDAEGNGFSFVSNSPTFLKGSWIIR